MFFGGPRPGGDCLDVDDGAEFVILASMLSLSFPLFKETHFPPSALEKCPLVGFFAELRLERVKDGLAGETQPNWGEVTEHERGEKNVMLLEHFELASHLNFKATRRI